MGVLVHLSCDPDMRFVPCDVCGGEGCTHCEGTGEMLVEVEPIDMDDLEEIYRD